MDETVVKESLTLVPFWVFILLMHDKSKINICQVDMSFYRLEVHI